MIEVTFPDLYPWILLTMAAIGIQCWFIPLIVVTKARFRAFPKEYMQRFSSIHKDAFEGLNPP